MNMEMYKDVAINTFVLLMPFAWVISSSVAAYKEKNRHSEISNVITHLNAQYKGNAEFALTAVKKLALQKSLIVMRDEDGVMSVHALDTAGKDEVKKALGPDTTDQ